MRHPVRPFITAYKGRSAKSSTARSLAALAASVDEEPRPKPAPLRLEEPAPAPTSHDDAYLAALRAADALFGRLGVAPAAPQPGSKSAPQPASGRILPSLLQEERDAVRFEEEPARKRGRKKRDAGALDLTPAPERAPRSPRSRRQPAGFDASREVEPAESPRLADGKLDGAKVQRAGAEAAKFSWSEPAAAASAAAAGEFAPAGSGEDRERRARRPIQRRWVLKTELRPGEKWKRRMRHATR